MFQFALKSIMHSGERVWYVCIMYELANSCEFRMIIDNCARMTY